MANFYGLLSNYLCWPTENDHYGEGVVGDARIITELNMTPLLAGLAGRNCVLSGFALPSSGNAVDGLITPGTAVVSGVYISGAWNRSLSVTYTSSAVNWVWLVLVRDGNGRVLRPEITVLTGALKPTDPSDSVILGSVTVDGSGVVTASSDFRYSGRIVRGGFTVTGDSAIGSIDYGSGAWTIAAGYLTATVTFGTAYLRAPWVKLSRFDDSTSTTYTTIARASGAATHAFAWAASSNGDIYNFEIAG
jgi:hypothetical protein